LVLIIAGCFGESSWENFASQVRETVETFSENPIIILPQSLCWKDTLYCAENQESTRRIYTGHSNLTLCAGDEETYKLMKQLYPNTPTLLAPDMTLGFDRQDFHDNSQPKEGVMLCLKVDRESILTDDDFKMLKVIAVILGGRVDLSDINLTGQGVYSFERDDVLYEKLQEFRNVKLVITDRLHGFIFSAITGTACVVLNDCNHKLKAAFRWVKHLPYMRFADGIEDVECLATEALAVGTGKYNITPLLFHFAELETLLREKIHGSAIQV
jgi:pyruvyl transferase EpsI